MCDRWTPECKRILTDLVINEQGRRFQIITVALAFLIECCYPFVFSYLLFVFENMDGPSMVEVSCRTCFGISTGGYPAQRDKFPAKRLKHPSPRVIDPSPSGNFGSPRGVVGSQSNDFLSFSEAIPTKRVTPLTASRRFYSFRCC